MLKYVHVSIILSRFPFFVSIDRKKLGYIGLLFCQPVAKVSGIDARCFCFSFVVRFSRSYQRPLACPRDIRVPPYFLSARIFLRRVSFLLSGPATRVKGKIYYSIFDLVGHLSVRKILMGRKHPIEMHIYEITKIIYNERESIEQDIRSDIKKRQINFQEK